MGGLYVYSNQMGCDGDRLYFDGSAIISLNGQLLVQSPQFSLAEVHVVTATADLDLIQILRGNRPSFTNQSAACHRQFPFEYGRIRLEGVRLCHPEESLAGMPVTSSVEPHYQGEENEIATGPALWMWDYMRKCGASGVFLPLSGGLDSCSCALIVYCMARFLAQNRASPTVRTDLVRVLGLEEMNEEAQEALLSDPRSITNRMLHTCYFGTANSSDASRNRAENLARVIGAYAGVDVHAIS